MSFSTMTPEARLEARARAEATRAVLQRAGADLRQDFADATHWRRLASDRGMRMPRSYLTPVPRMMRRCLRQVGVTGADYCAWAGEQTLKTFRTRNPRWPLWAWLGLVLEGLDCGDLVPMPAQGCAEGLDGGDALDEDPDSPAETPKEVEWPA